MILPFNNIYLNSPIILSYMILGKIKSPSMRGVFYL
nr:MAG TPA: hypothetical protein [Caudoviricetes sp.]